jgi:hypothetical protein
MTMGLLDKILFPLEICDAEEREFQRWMHEDEVAKAAAESEQPTSNVVWGVDFVTRKRA